MAKKHLKRVNKTKKEIVSDMQLVNDANRRRALIKDVIFPYLLEVNETIGYTKIFLQAFSGLVEGVFDDTRKTTTIGHINQKIVEKLENVFNVKDPEQKKEYDRYITFLGKLNDISVNDLSYAAELPRYIDGFTTKNIGKESIKTVNVDEILG